MQRMIGYRLKRLDQLIEDTFDRVFAAAGVSRRQWQVLNVLSRADATDDDLLEALRPFGEGGTLDAVGELAARGWVVRHSLTSAGREAHAALAERVGAIRARMTAGVSEDEYHATMAVLERMTANLEPLTS